MEQIKAIGEFLISSFPKLIALVPTPVQVVLKVALCITIILLALWAMLFVYAQVQRLFVEHIKPLVYNVENKRRSRRRRNFAQSIENELRRLNTREDWRDYEFTEIEAEVETDGATSSFGRMLLCWRRPGLRREKTLSRALQKSRDRCILVEGEPGSGKTVALRHVALLCARSASRSHSVNSIVPIYINLKDLKRKHGTAIDSNLIREFVKSSINNANDRDVDEFLSTEFAIGMEHGSWFFLFDSFDEIPEIISATEANEFIRLYSLAISDFLSGFNKCRGIVASREFRGPRSLGWPVFKILKLSELRRRQLIKLSVMTRADENTLLNGLFTANDDILGMASNPMFLGLMCNYVRESHIFPITAYSVFEAYIDSRLTRDEARISSRFSLTVGHIREAAEAIAYCMAVNDDLGLNPTRQALKEALRSCSMTVKQLDKCLDSLEYVKLGRCDEGKLNVEEVTFTFTHRRFQEYFATCEILKKPERVSPSMLLFDGRWREAAVVFLQTQSITSVTTLFVAVESYFDEVFQRNVECISGNANSGNLKTNDTFEWPAKFMHIVLLLRDGLVYRRSEIPIKIRSTIGSTLELARKQGTIVDQREALNVAILAEDEILTTQIRAAFKTKSLRMAEAAYMQTGFLYQIPHDIRVSIKKFLTELWHSGRISKEYYSVEASLQRLPESTDFLKSISLLRNSVSYILLSQIIILGVFSYLSHAYALAGQRQSTHKLSEYCSKTFPQDAATVRNNLIKLHSYPFQSVRAALSNRKLVMSGQPTDPAQHLPADLSKSADAIVAAIDTASLWSYVPKTNRSSFFSPYTTEIYDNKPANIPRLVKYIAQYNLGNVSSQMSKKATLVNEARDEHAFYERFLGLQTESLKALNGVQAESRLVGAYRRNILIPVWAWLTICWFACFLNLGSIGRERCSNRFSAFINPVLMLFMSLIVMFLCMLSPTSARDVDIHLFGSITCSATLIAILNCWPKMLFKIIECGYPLKNRYMVSKLLLSPLVLAFSVIKENPVTVLLALLAGCIASFVSYLFLISIEHTHVYLLVCLIVLSTIIGLIRPVKAYTSDIARYTKLDLDNISAIDSLGLLRDFATYAFRDRLLNNIHAKYERDHAYLSTEILRLYIDSHYRWLSPSLIDRLLMLHDIVGQGDYLSGPNA